MTLEEMREFIGSYTSHVLFDYNGKNCGIDPFYENDFDMWYGDDDITVNSLDEVFSTPFFGGKCLNDIADKIENVEW